ncbi:MAG: diadenosine tetraphosphate (Ap4A) HIT family hydrolase [Candidatus Woesearchaeota archaeon]|jgi:diadenosine tetraphosphate (Ap4A) HIT family hydrolase
MTLLWEDDIAKVEMATKPITQGHLKVFAQTAYKTVEAIPKETLSHLFAVASRCATILFEGLKAQGTNIIIKNGPASGQETESVCIDVIARNENDGLNFVWQPTQGDQAQIQQTAKDIASKIVIYEPTTQAQATVVEEPRSKEEEKEVEDYLLHELERMP